jgi:Na+/proline symporter
MQRDVAALIDGGIGGCIGTVVMSAVMLAAEKAGFMDRQPPEEIAGAALDAAGMTDRAEETEDVLAVLGHFGFGIAAGALFGLLHRRLRLPIPAALHGVVFGSLVWAASYKGWIPALGIMPPPERDQPGRPTSMVLAHWFYGGTLGTFVGRR